MEKIFGPFDGYVAVVSVREVSGQNKFAASYELWLGVPEANDASAKPVKRKSVGGLSRSVDDAFDIALQLARLHITSLHGPRVTPHVNATSRLAQFAKSWEEASPPRDFTPYQPTMACPLR